MIQYAVTEWLTDIRKNQLPGILGGVGPMHSVVQLCKQNFFATELFAVFKRVFFFYLLIFFFSSSVCVWSVHGVRDLFWLPIEQYRKDGRIIRGLQRGAASFGTSTASAALELSNRLVQAIQVGKKYTQNGLQILLRWIPLTHVVLVNRLQATAETVYDILSPTPPLNRFAITEGRAPSSRPRRAAQPADLREGVAKAYDTVREVRILSL